MGEGKIGEGKMGEGKIDDPRDPRPGKPEHAGKQTPRRPAAVSTNTRLELQTRKVLGKHYANKYGTRRG